MEARQRAKEKQAAQPVHEDDAVSVYSRERDRERERERERGIERERERERGREGGGERERAILNTLNLCYCLHPF